MGATWGSTPEEVAFRYFQRQQQLAQLEQEQQQEQAVVPKPSKARTRRPGAGKKPLLTCEHCGAAFPARRSTARFCSTRCRVDVHRKSKSQLSTSMASVQS